MSGIGRHIEENLSQAEANIRQMECARAVIDANRDNIKSAPWRLIRNRKLLAASRQLAALNGELLRANELLMEVNAELLALHMEFIWSTGRDREQ